MRALWRAVKIYIKHISHYNIYEDCTNTIQNNTDMQKRLKS